MHSVTVGVLAGIGFIWEQTGARTRDPTKKNTVPRRYKVRFLGAMDPERYPACSLAPKCTVTMLPQPPVLSSAIECAKPPPHESLSDHWP